MSARDVPKGDSARVSIRVEVDCALAFRLFTEEIDRWWLRGLRYRVAGLRRGIVHLEGQVGGRLFESFDTDEGTKVFETGRVTAWEPPARLVFEWRGVNFAPGEKTEVEVTFAPSGAAATLVTVTHRGFASLRPDHPVRHGQSEAAFIRGMGMWWGDLMTSLRELAATAQPRT